MGAEKRIALVGAGGMAFGPVMTYDAIRSEGFEGSTLVLVDINRKRLEAARAIADRLNEAMGCPLRIEAESDTERGVEGADFVMLSVEKGRWEGWTQDYEIPRKHGSTQVMGENGGPGGLFHSLRSIKLVLEICELIEKCSPDAFVVNLTNPMSRVTLAINRATKLKNIGLCHEFTGGLLRIAAALLIPPNKIQAKASGMNHFTWFYEITNADTGEDLYPKMIRHVRMFPLLHSPLVRRCALKYGCYPTSTDSHIGEYIPWVADVVKPIIPFHTFFEHEGELRETLTKWYGKGYFQLPVKMLPESGEEALPICEALATGASREFNAINVPNKGYIPNLPEGAIVEVPARSDGETLIPEEVPPVNEDLAEMMRTQYRIQEMIVDSALNRDPELAFEALVADPLSPPESACRAMFEEMTKLQKKQLPF